jgi:hypothetical protein
VQRYTEGISSGSVIYAHRPAGGAWTPWSEIHTYPPEMRHCSMFTDRDGGIHATWKGWGVPGRYRFAPSGGSLDAPTAATAEIPLPPDVASVGMGDSFALVGGAVYHAFVSFDDYSINCSRLEPAGASFAWLGQPSGGPIAHVEPYDPWPAVAALGVDGVVVAWADQSGASGEVRVDRVWIAVWDGGGWERQVIDSTADVDPDGKPALTVTDDTVWLVWRGEGGYLRLATAAL